MRGSFREGGAGCVLMTMPGGGGIRIKRGDSSKDAEEKKEAEEDEEEREVAMVA